MCSLEGQLREKAEAWEKIEKMALSNPDVSKTERG
jgi:hypothetical protein